ncbi:MAG: hypothetical protein HOC71_07530 [Candidatus Latescibacteria bacterium]|jgi:hypothetical protein|nr:hypothetical protein [Candidatus Latescibacterota bacterium]
MLKLVTSLGLSILIIFSSTAIVFAQEEESFIRGTQVNKREGILLSALFPGLGQMTQGQKVKGISFFIGEAVSLIVLINTHENYNTKQKIYERDLEVYNDLRKTPGKSDVDRRNLLKELNDDNDTLDNLHTYRQTALIVAAGIYAYNIFDSILFSSSSSESRRAELNNNKFKVNSVIIDNNPGIMLSKRF